MYTIDNFLDIKKEIYEYCLNLTMTTVSGLRFRHKDRADDLFQDVYLRSYEYLPTLNREILTIKEYTAKIKIVTFWTYTKHFDRRLKKNKITCNLNHYQDSETSEYHIQKSLYEDPQVFTDIVNHPDFRFFTRNLDDKELDIVRMVIEGYTFDEVSKKYNNKVLHLVLSKLINNQIERYRTVKPLEEKSINDLEFLKSKIQVINFNHIFTTRLGRSKTNTIDEYKVKLYSMYLQGNDLSFIAKKLGKTKNQIGVEIYRIKKQIKE